MSDVPTPRVKAPLVDVRAAWRLHRALLVAQGVEPALAEDALFQVFKAEAYERFERSMREDRT